MDIHLRAATAADHEFLHTLNRAAHETLATRLFGSWDDVAQRARFESKIRRLQFRIIELDDQPVGAVSSSEHEAHVFLNEILVLPEFQNRGIGSFVLGFELAQAKVLGKPIRLHTARLNRAQELFRRHGFVETGRDDTFIDMVSTG
jgi:ribosomal protein S18 acetylase RimI-like enzyme